MTELKENLKERNYPDNLIDDGIKRAMEQKRTDLLRTKLKEKDDVIAFVSTYNPKNPELFPTILRNQNIIKQSERMRSILDSTNIIKSKRQSWNLKKILTRAKFETVHENPSVSKCNRSRCKVCNFILEGNTISFNNNKKFIIKSNMDCDARNVIYAIICNGCNKKYIGETTNLRSRVTLHNQHINHPELRKIPLSKHIDECTNIQPKYKIFPFYKLQQEDRLRRRIKEEHFINIFQPELNSCMQPK